MMCRRGFAVVPLLIIIAALAAVIGLALIIFNPGQKLPRLQGNNNAVACTLEARLCPDGSYVSRVPPNCEFAACPGENPNANAPTNTSSGGVFNTATGTDADTPAAANANISPGATVNTNTSASNSNANVNSATNANVNAIASLPVVTVIEATSKPTTYDGQQLCLTGAFQSSFETNIFGSSIGTDNYGNEVLKEPYVWSETTPSLTSFRCQGGERKLCLGTTMQCGTFEYAAAGETGFGNQNNYRYQLRNATNSTTVTPAAGARCAEYVRPEGRVTYCATCGDGTCEAIEQCSPSTMTKEMQSNDCGPLYCQQDC